jgi:hypothetical protein
VDPSYGPIGEEEPFQSGLQQVQGQQDPMCEPWKPQCLCSVPETKTFMFLLTNSGAAETESKQI